MSFFSSLPSIAGMYFSNVLNPYDPSINTQASFYPNMTSRQPNMASTEPNNDDPIYVKNATCYTDDDCMNMDAFSSSPNKIVYSCPDAKCVSNSCTCGANCKKDPYSGTCCQGIETIRGDTFCIENTAIPGLGNIKYSMKQKAMKQQAMKRAMTQRRQ